MRLRASHAQPRTQHGGDGADKHWVRVGAASVAGTRSSMLGSIEFSGKGSWGVGGDVCSSPSGVVQNNASKVRNAISRPSSLRVGITRCYSRNCPASPCPAASRSEADTRARVASGNSGSKFCIS